MLQNPSCPNENSAAYSKDKKGDEIMNGKQSLVVISAPSGCGKDTIIEKVLQRLDGIGVSISCTTRSPRRKYGDVYEQDGVDYFFIGHEEFEQRIRSDGFLEYAEHAGDLYGTPRDYIEKLCRDGNDMILLNIEHEGAAQIKAMYPAAVSIFILPPSAQEVRRRLVERNSDTPEKIERRIRNGAAQTRMAYMYDYIVMNDQLEDAVEDVIHILCTVRRRTMLHKKLIDEVNATFVRETAQPAL